MIPAIWKGVTGVRCKRGHGDILFPEGSTSFTLSFDPQYPQHVSVDSGRFIWVHYSKVERLVPVSGDYNNWIG